MICPWDAGSLQRPSKAPKARHCYCLWGRPRSLLLRHFRPFWPFASLSLLLPHSYCPSLTFCAWRKVIWWEGERTGGQRAARRGKSGGTEESNQINIIILQWLPFTLPVATHIHVWWYLHIQCDSFYCSAQKMSFRLLSSKCQTFLRVWYLVIFRAEQ